MNHAGTIPVHTLLEHHDFVRRLARSLVRDEALADDLAQDAWLAALENPPREATSLRGWFASVLKSRVANRRRSEERRVGREAAVARADEDAADAQRVERLETGQSVVAAVLALEEPYRSVILLAYFEGLQPAEIARRRGVPAGTVRSQLSRGHALLREKLDRKFGERRAWLAALAPLAVVQPEAVGAGIGGAKLALGAALLIAAGAAPFVWSAWQARTSTSVAVAEPASWQRDVEFLAALAAPGAESPREELAPLDPTPAQASSPAAPAPVAAPLDVSGLSLDELLVLAEHTQNLVRERVLLSTGDWPEALRSLSVRNDTGICWLLPSGRFPDEAYSPLGIRGGGAYWSFTLRTHESDQLPDLGLEAGFFRTSHLGGLAQLECASLVDVPTRADAASSEWTERAREAWGALWSQRKPEASSAYPEFRAALERGGLVSSLRAARDGVYALRSVHVGESADTLVAFQVVDAHEGAVRIVWRTLAEFEAPVGPRRMADEPPRLATGPAPERLVALDIARLLETLAAIRAAAQAKLFAIDPALQQRYAGFASRPGSGIVRILERGKYVRVVEKRAAGYCWSFATRDHDYDKEPDLGLEQGRLGSGFYGQTAGLLIDCGKVAVEDVVVWGRVPPADWPAERRNAFTFLWDVRPAPRADRPGAKSLSEQDRKRVDELHLRSGPKAVVGHTYLVRSNLSEEHDLIAAFEVVEHSETGITIVWRTLADFSGE